MKCAHQKVSHQHGQALVELVLVIAIISILFLFSMDSLRNIFGSQIRSDHKLEATQLAVEGLEFAYNLNVNTGFAFTQGLIQNQTPTLYYIDLTTPAANLVPANHSQASHYKLIDDRYTRELWYEYALRNDNEELSEITDETLHVDSQTVKVRSRISWQEEAQSREIQMSTYLVDLATNH